LTGAIKTAEWKLADRSLRHVGQRLTSWAVANARVEPKGNAIITKPASESAKIDPLMAAFNAIALIGPSASCRSYVAKATRPATQQRSP
jgi:phage terminase large subunit-like protein